MARHLSRSRLLSLAAPLALVLFSSAAHADKKVLVARPGLAPGLSDGQKKSIRDGMYRGLTAAKAYAVDEGDIGDEMKKAGVTSLVSKTASMKVAKQIDAYAVLRYQAKPAGDKVKVRVTVVTTHKDTLAFRDAFATSEKLEGVVEDMTRALMGVAARGGAGSQPAGGAGDQAGETPSPLAQRLFHQPNPHAASGFVAEAHIGFGSPLGDDGDFLKLGLRTGAMLGWQIQLGNFQSITPGVFFSLALHGYDDNVLAAVNATDGSFTQISALGGARYTLYLGGFGLFAGVYLGLGWAQESLSNPSQDLSNAGAGFGMSVQFGAFYMFLERLGAGVFFDVAKRFVGTINATEYEAGNFAMGFAVRTKL